MSGTQPQDLPSSGGAGDLADYAALPDKTHGSDDWAPGAGSDGAQSDPAAVPGDVDISRNEGPELTTGVADVATGAAVSGPSGGATSARGDDTGTETPPGAVPDDEP